MTEQRLIQVREICEAAARLPAPERPFFLDKACGLDRELRAAVERMLRERERDRARHPEPPSSDHIVTAASIKRDKPASAVPVIPFGPTVVDRNPSPPRPTSRRPGVDHGRFAPGDVVAGRYRIVALLGRGGMGEVYRADDLTLEQTVALKFLPVATEADPQWLADLIGEVRTARQVAHPNVCRVYDIEQHAGDAASGPCRFIAMEYITGESLDSLLRRAGRLSGERAVQIARGLCEGLAAIHDLGVLHRDFKPTNVLIDAEGRARITDFGLATPPEEHGRLVGEAAAAGTPGYIAPEALAGKEATPRSDIYALGLVLYELFTGKRAYEGTDGSAILRAQERDDPLAPSAVASGVDPLVERVILRCIERVPSARPESARMVARMLPGGDALAAALALGETPSPKSSPRRKSGRMNAGLAGLILALIAVALSAILWFSDRHSLVAHSGLRKSPEVLADRAQQILHSLNYHNEPEAVAYAFDLYEQLLDVVGNVKDKPRKWDLIRGPRPTAIDFWYRQAPMSLVPLSPGGRVMWTDPPPIDAGMIGVRLTPTGQLRELSVMPNDTYRLSAAPGAASSEAVAAPYSATYDAAWDALFAAADLDRSKFERVTPARLPPQFADVRAAWRGKYPDNQAVSVRVEAGLLAGQAVAFRVIEEDWSGASEFSFTPVPTKRQKYGELVTRAMQAVALAGAIVLARRHWVRKRGDWAGARRLAIFAFFASLIGSLLVSHSLKHLGTGLDLMGAAGTAAGIIESSLGKATFWAAWMWLFYVALEPMIRRSWPETVISWARLLSGRVLDPLVGKSILFGVGLGVAAIMLIFADNLVASAIGDMQQPVINGAWSVTALEGPRVQTGMLMVFAVNAMQFALVFVMGLVLVKLLTKKRLFAAIIFTAIQAAAWSLVESSPWTGWFFYGAIAALCTLVLVRLGLLSLVIGALTAFILRTFPLTLDPACWYAGATWMGVGVIGGLALFGAAAATGLLVPRRSPIAFGLQPSA